MPPQRQRKRKSTASIPASSNTGLDNFPAPPQIVPTKGDPNTSSTPERSQPNPEVRITQAQKQALIDNLQLEITERARKLRAQYVLQAQGLRTRMEIRIHRIPAGLRKVTMGELYEKQMEKAEPAQQKGKAAAIAAHQTLDPTEYISPNKTRPSPSKTIKTIAPEVRPQRKRTSDEISDADKENAPAMHPAKRARADPLSEPTKPTKPVTATTAGARAASRRLGPSREVLSPKSNNSRTLPHSPFKAPMLPSSPYKSNMPRPVSPLRPMPAVTVAPTASSLAKTADKPKARAAPAGSRAASRQGNATASTAAAGRGKRTAAATANANANATLAQEEASGRTSSASNETSTSAGTTIVKKTTRAAAPAAAAASKAKKPGVVKRMAAGINAKKATETAGEKGKVGTVGGIGATVKGGRTLRKRA